VLAALGTGGMAEVYRARDTRLGRDVALKVVNERLVRDPDLLRRFEQEARVAGSLNHANLVAVFDVGDHDGSPYLVTELLQGESLRAKLMRGRIPVQTALAWAAQVARGLAAAHARGIVHRDVKPDNLFVGADGQVKLLDFGIAKLSQDGPTLPHGLNEATLQPDATAPGAVLGTPGYMAPEQVRGDPVDARTDLFAVGAVLHEMLTGQRAFPGATFVEAGYAILHQDPSPFPPELPNAVAQVVQRCLEKEPGRRFQSASDLAFALDVLRGPTTAPEPALLPAASRRPRWLVGALAAALCLTAVGVAVARFPRAHVLQPRVDQISYRWGTVTGARFTPDGRVLFSGAFEGQPEELYTRPGSGTAQAIGVRDASLAAVSRSGELAVLVHPSFSFFLARRGTLARLPEAGSAPRAVAEDVEFADWSPEGELAFVRVVGRTRVLEFPAGRALFRTNGWISHLRFSHQGARIAFLHHPVYADDAGIVMVVDRSGEAHTLGHEWPRTYGLAWSPDDREILFTAGNLLRNVLAAVSTAGKERTVYQHLTEIRLEDVATDGSILLSGQVERSELVYVPAPGSPGRMLSFTDWTSGVGAISADGQILFSANAPTETSGGTEVAILRSTDGSPARVLGDGKANDLSADGRWALVTTPGGGVISLPTGPGQARTIPSPGVEIWSARWFRDGKRLVALGRDPSGTGVHLYLLDGGSAPARRVSDVPVVERAVALSPDERRAAVVGSEGRVLVVSLEDGLAQDVPGASGVPRRWASDHELWLSRSGHNMPAENTVLRVDVRTGKTIERRTYRPSEPAGSTSRSDLEIAPDGQGVAYTEGRIVGSLYLVRGLVPPRR
jgi:serine/threonine protein kinase/Tol biopolymer transport system component